MSPAIVRSSKRPRSEPAFGASPSHNRVGGEIARGHDYVSNALRGDRVRGLFYRSMIRRDAQEPPVTRRRMTVPVMAAVLLLAACASGVRKPDVSLPAAYEAPPGTQTLSDAQLDRWWTIFGDEQLNKLEDA